MPAPSCHHINKKLQFYLVSYVPKPTSTSHPEEVKWHKLAVTEQILLAVISHENTTDLLDIVLHSVKIVVPGWQYFNCWRNAPDYQKSGFKSHSGLSLVYLVCEFQYLTANKTVVFLLSQNRETNHGNEVARRPFVFFKSSFYVTLTPTSAGNQMAYIGFC